MMQGVSKNRFGIMTNQAKQMIGGVLQPIVSKPVYFLSTSGTTTAPSAV